MIVTNQIMCYHFLLSCFSCDHKSLQDVSYEGTNAPLLSWYHAMNLKVNYMNVLAMFLNHFVEPLRSTVEVVDA